MVTIRISAKTARTLLSLCPEGAASPAEAAAGRELERALAALRSPKKLATRRVNRVARESKAKTKKAKTAGVRAACLLRSRNQCEACGMQPTPGSPLTLDHFFGRAREESVETCWMLCWSCHRQKTDSEPTALYWLGEFIYHCEVHGYAAARSRAYVRLAFLEARKGGAR